jgi:glycosyl transferase family 25
MPERPAIYVLSFPGAGPERHQAPAAQFARLATPVDWELVMGFGTESEILDVLYDADLNARWLKRPLAPAEIAVYAGHRKMFAEFLASHADIGLFLEDDFDILRPDAFIYLLDHAQEAIGNADILKLYNYGDKPGRTVRQRTCGPLQIAKHHRNSAGAVGYVLTRAGAEKLLAQERLFRQIDEDFKHPWEFDLDIWSVTPNLVGENSQFLGGSLLEAQRRAIKESHRSVVVSMKGNYLALRRKLMGLYHSLVEERT